MTATPKHRLRWFQYSLRSLFVLTVLVAVGGSWFAVKKQQVERQRAAVAWIKELGGHVIFDWDIDAAGRLIPNSEPPGPPWFRHVFGDDFLAHVVWVMLHNTPATDVGLQRLKGLPHLKTLFLGGTGVTDAGLEHFEGLAQLEYLSLDGTQVTDAGLEHLKGLTQLRQLVLDNTKVTDAGLEHPKGLIQLQSLSLSSTKITDAALEHLKGLTQLRELRLDDTKVTDEGAKRLQQTLPNCIIRR